MKLIDRFTLWYLFISAIVLVIGGMLVFNSVQNEILAEEDRRLRDTVKLIARSLEAGTEIDDIAGHQVAIHELAQTASLIPMHVTDTLAWFAPHQHYERELRATASYKFKDKHYFISASNLIAESDDLLKGVSNSLWWTFLLLLLVVGISSRLISNWVLKPFQNTLQVIQSFHLKQQHPIELMPTTTREFKTLNQFLKKMTTKALEDYRSLKEFSENASHELQTPLAIIRGKLELLMDQTIDDNQARLILEAHNAVDKLSKINKSLTLLTKLENQEFEAIHPINFSKLTEDTLQSFDELVEMKSLALEKQIEPNIHLTLNPELAIILLNNLLANAIRHNHENGSIRVILSSAGLTVQNTGNPPEMPIEQLFERFKKSNQSSDSIGLGLSIVKQICELNYFKVNYRYQDQLHTLDIVFYPPV
ncbi:HAMP domain-containing histidine kinase [Rhodocytophaga rosea]|uniref:histidine kinase n=1 Tax=Rhodocytophaga rosea TaxID=2704465 RepID=A0A6C0GJI5_9BACT|nr:HAMP domain-containing sensor histidine kinase [Rhodocytophaga rosea]QHT67822.1 HAMP domain-containing histidine kinase [Rhodocytophaga rosea]